MPLKTSWLGACRGPDGCRSRPTPCLVRPVSRCGFAPRPRTSVLDPPPVRLHNCASGRASFAKHALEPNPSRGGAQQGARAAKACPKWLGGSAPCSDESAFSPRHRSENRLESLPIYSFFLNKARNSFETELYSQFSHVGSSFRADSSRCGADPGSSGVGRAYRGQVHRASPWRTPSRRLADSAPTMPLSPPPPPPPPALPATWCSATPPS